MMDNNKFFESIDDVQYAYFDYLSQKIEVARFDIDKYEESRDENFHDYAVEDVEEIRGELESCSDPHMQIVIDFVNDLVDAEEERLKKLGES